MKQELSQLKQDMIAEIQQRLEDKVLEHSNAELLMKLITQADNDDEAIKIMSLGTTYKKSGLHYEKRLEKMDNTIRYYRKNDALSFHTDNSKPTHKLIIGDNYEALQNLLIQYKKGVDVIYIDPPYGKDSMGDFAKTNYENGITRDNLLSMLYPRLMLAKQLLKEDGVIFCSIDDKNQAYVKCLFDEVMGERNFIGMFMWYKSETPPNLSKKIKKNLEYILCYQRIKDNSKFVGFKTESSSSDPVTKPQNTLKEWKIPANALIIKEKDGIIKAGTYGTPKYPNILKNDLVVKNGTNENEAIFENRFIWTQQTLEETLPTINMFLSKSLVLSYKRFEYETSVPSNLIDNSVGVTTTEKARTELINIMGKDLFEYPKPEDLISYLISFIDRKNITVMDFFAGSGTTGHAVLELNKKDTGNRQFILCQLNEITDTTPNGIAYDVTSKRLKRIMTGACYDGSKDFPWLKDNEPYGGNLDVYEIERIPNHLTADGKTPFGAIDETLYGKDKFKTLKEKIDWVCQNFANAQKYVENDEDWEERIKD
jgi:adenine-specific DNA-methyltransferase